MPIWVLGSDAESLRVKSLLEPKVEADVLVILDLSGSDNLQKTLTAKKIRDYLMRNTLLDKITRIDFYTSNLVSEAEEVCGVPDLAEQAVNLIYEEHSLFLTAHYVTRSSADVVRLVGPSAENGENWQTFDEKGVLIWQGKDLNSLLESEEHTVKPFAVTYSYIAG